MVVVLITTVIHGLKPGRVRRIRQALQIDARTSKRWRQWWLDSFVRSSFWKAGWARFIPPLSERTLPLSLWRRCGLPAGGAPVPKAGYHPHGLEGARYVRGLFNSRRGCRWRPQRHRW